MLLSNDPCAKNEVSPTIDQKNVRVGSQGTKSFLFCYLLKEWQDNIFNPFDYLSFTIYNLKRGEEHFPSTSSCCKERGSTGRVQGWELLLWRQSVWALTHDVTLGLTFL